MSIKKLIAVFLCLCTFVSLCTLSMYAEYENTHKNSGDMASDIVAIAMTQLGYMEGSLEGTVQKGNDCTKYGEWYGYNYCAWCAMFVSWCANQAGIPTSCIPKHASCDVGMQWFIDNNRWYYADYYATSKYTPKVGDIVYFGYKMSSGSFDSTHVGIVYSVDDTYVYSVEGNSSNKVQKVPYKRGSSYVLGYGHPNYAGSSQIPVDPPQENKYETGLYMVTDTSSLNLRAQPNSDSSTEILTVVPKWCVFKVTEISNEYWGKTTYNSKTGWISLRYCTFTYSIAYNANGGTGAPSTQYKCKGETLTLTSSVPIRSGYSFLGWAVSSTATNAQYAPGGTYKNDANVTLYAVWSSAPAVETYKITFNANGGTGAPSQITKTNGIDVTLPAATPQKSGYHFLGWALSANATSAVYKAGDKFTKNENTTLYAVWEELYTLKFNMNGGSGTIANITKYKGKDVTIPTTEPTRSGYVFLGWALNADAPLPTYLPMDKYSTDANATFYAIWNAVYTIKFNANGGTGAPKDITKLNGVSVNLPTDIPKYEGYIFMGWARTKAPLSVEYNAGDKFTLNQNTTLYAVWKENDYSIKVNLDSNGSFKRSVKDGYVIVTVTANPDYCISDLQLDSEYVTLLSDTTEYDFKFNDGLPHTIDVGFSYNLIAWDNPFSDVASNAWYSRAIEFCQTNSIMNGTGGGLFSPNSSITRSTVMIVLQKLYALDNDDVPLYLESPFPDVDIDSYYGQAVAWAYGNGLTSGNELGLFNPGASLTREQLAVILKQASSLFGIGSGDIDLTSINEFSDASQISNWAKEGMAFCVQNGLISGSNEKVLMPKGNATRSQTAQIVYTMFNR